MINYYLITKPGIVLGNLITVAAGFLLASKGIFYPWLFLATLLGLGFIMASACVFNNYIDRNVDQKMNRTKKRPLASGLIEGKHALVFGTLLALIGNGILYFNTNALTVFVANVGFFVYVVLYSLWKGRTIYGTAIGSIAGAVPPVVGYCAVTNRFDLGALLLFLMLVLWQMPHFFAIALYHFDDYAAAKIPVLPIMKGALRTKIHMVLYIAAFIVVSALFTYFGYTGISYLATTTAGGLAWLALCLAGFSTANNQLWGQRMFRFSLVLISVISIGLSLDVV